MPPTELAIAIIRTDGETQSRVSLDVNTVHDYAEQMKAGAEFPAIAVRFDGSEYWLEDGFHRLKAAQLAGFGSIVAEVEPGTLEEARWNAARANSTHGLRRSNADTRKAVIMALLNPRSAGKTDAAIAAHVGCSAPTVGKYRAELEATQKISSQPVRETRDGRTINTANIGSKQADPTPKVAPRGPGLWRLRSEIEDLLDLTWPKLFKAVQRRTQAASPYLLIRTSRGHVAILDAAKAIAEQTGETTLHTEYGEALFFDHHDPQQLRTGIESHASVRWLAKTACVFEYEDTSKEVEAFYTHHGVIRKNMMTRGEKVSPPSADAARNAIAWENARASDTESPDAPAGALENMPEPMPAEPPARVVHFHNAADHWNALSEEWEDDQYVYIGRGSASHNLPQSPWHNPFRMVHESQRADVIQRYRDHITPLVASGELDIEALRGKTLVCWCKPKDCHGDVLVELLAARDATVRTERTDATPVETVNTVTTVEDVPLQVGDWVHTRTGRPGQIVRLDGGRFAYVRDRYANLNRHYLDSLTKIDPPVDAPPMIAPSASVPLGTQDTPGFGQQQAADCAWVMPRPAEQAYAPNAQRIIEWLHETLRDDPADDERRLIRANGMPVYAGDIRALLAQVAMVLEPTP